jgi:hypothetical protein
VIAVRLTHRGESKNRATLLITAGPCRDDKTGFRSEFKSAIKNFDKLTGKLHTYISLCPNVIYEPMGARKRVQKEAHTYA